jgi:hypothetical protein
MRMGQRQQNNVPFLILPLGNQEFILGRTWLAEFYIKVDCAYRKLE